MKPWLSSPIPSPAAGRQLKLFVLSGICTVLVTRAFLALADYPKLGGTGTTSSVHIAHMLWGGLLMAGGSMLLLTCLGPLVRTWGAVVSGVGFGLFIDEIGKQVSNKGYLYAPAAGLIYLTFAVLAGFAWRTSAYNGGQTARGATAQAGDAALSGLTHGLTPQQRTAARRLLEQSDEDTDRALLHLLDTLPDREPQHARLRAAVARARHTLARAATDRRVVVAALLLIPLHSFLRLGRNGAELIGGRWDEPEWNALLASAAFNLTALILSLLGAALLRHDRTAALRTLRAAVLVGLLPSQVLGFVIHQFSALQDVVIGLTLLWISGVELNRRRGPARDTREAHATASAGRQPVSLVRAGDAPGR